MSRTDTNHGADAMTTRYEIQTRTAYTSWEREASSEDFEERDYAERAILALEDRNDDGDQIEYRVVEIERQTIAEQVADALDNDGQMFETRGGQTLDGLASRHGATVEIREADFRHERAVRYIFPDRSAIVAMPGAWDLSYADCWCWRGVGHTAECRGEEE